MKALSFIVLISIFTSIPMVQAQDCWDARLIYKICTDQGEIYNQAAQKAVAENKLVLIKFGYSQCPWCQSLHKLFGSADFWSDLENQYELAEIGVFNYNHSSGEFDKIESGLTLRDEILLANNLDKEEVITGYPVLAVVRPSDKKAIFIDTGDLEDNSNGEGHDPELVKRALLKAATQF